MSAVFRKGPLGLEPELSISRRIWAAGERTVHSLDQFLDRQFPAAVRIEGRTSVGRGVSDEQGSSYMEPLYRRPLSGLFRRDSNWRPWLSTVPTRCANAETRISADELFGRVACTLFSAKLTDDRHGSDQFPPTGLMEKLHSELFSPRARVLPLAGSGRFGDVGNGKSPKFHACCLHCGA